MRNTSGELAGLITARDDILADFIDGYGVPPTYVAANLDFSAERNSANASSCSALATVMCSHSSQYQAGMRCPHQICLEIHQSGRPATMPSMRCSPQSGSHSTVPMADSAASQLTGPSGGGLEAQEIGADQ